MMYEVSLVFHFEADTPEAAVDQFLDVLENGEPQKLTFDVRDVGEIHAVPRRIYWKPEEQHHE